MIVSLFTLSLIGFFVPCSVQAQDKGKDISKMIELKDMRLAKGPAMGIKIMRNNEIVGLSYQLMVSTHMFCKIAGEFDENNKKRRDP